MRRLLVGIAALGLLTVAACSSSPQGGDGGGGNDTKKDTGGTMDMAATDRTDMGGNDVPPTDMRNDTPPVDMRNDTPPADMPPADMPPADMMMGDSGANCTPLVLEGVSPATLEQATITPNGMGGDIASGTYVATSVKYDFAVAVMGTATGVIEITAANGTAGTARVAIKGDITSPIAAMFDQTGAGGYTAANSQLNILADCGGMSPISNAEYTATPTTLTIWTTIMAMGIPVPLEILLTKM